MDPIAKRLKAARIAAGYKTAKEFADKNDIPQSTYQLHETGKRGLTNHRTLMRYAEALGVPPGWLVTGEGPGLKKPVDDIPASQTASENMVDPRNDLTVSSSPGVTRTGAELVPITAKAPIIGAVQAGAWTEAYQFPEREWEWMSMPPDERFPGVQQYLFENVGESMNLVCPDGGMWAVVFYRDLFGQGPASGQYVVVERHRGGMVEATVKKFKTGADGKPWLYPESNDPRFKPFPLEPADPEMEEIRVVARATKTIALLP